MRFSHDKRSRRSSIIITLIGAFALMLGLTAAPVHAHHNQAGQGGEGAGTVHFQGIPQPNNGVCQEDPDQAPPDFAHGNHLGDPDDGKDGACLPVFPANPGVNGDFDGDVAGDASGTDVKDDGTNPQVPWSVVIDDARIDADFSYQEDPLTCPLEGTANGTFEIEDTDVSGVYQDGMGRTVTEAHATGRFVWTRVGINAAITVSEVDVWLHFGNGDTELVLDDAGGSATATFEASSNAATCPGSSVTAAVIGDAEFSVPN